jgi:hypothetical protein
MRVNGERAAAELGARHVEDDPEPRHRRRVARRAPGRSDHRGPVPPDHRRHRWADRATVRAPAHPDYGNVLGWLRSLPDPVAVTYDPGPTTAWLGPGRAGIARLVMAPSTLQRPAGDRVKTDVRNARYLARLLHLGRDRRRRDSNEAARDLVRAPARPNPVPEGVLADRLAGLAPCRDTSLDVLPDRRPVEVRSPRHIASSGVTCRGRLGLPGAPDQVMAYGSELHGNDHQVRLGYWSSPLR